MPLGSGTRLGPYEILSAIGAGGMGEVYRAADTVLGRHVAIKVLPEAFAQDAERLARFEREAKTLAVLNHPHIAQIYGLERSGGTPALVMELVDGETLADRIARGAIPFDEAVPIAKQIADALEAAHEQGIIHRDLKPANIKVTLDGRVKVLDFGLAKLSEPGSGIRAPGSGGAALSMSPTITSPALMTGVGVLLGTAAYMSPEQAKGREADKRSDVWAFGCVFYEMLTGRRPFDGEDVSDTLANVLKIDPDWTKLPADLPSTIGTVIRGCLEKNRAQRISDVAVVRFLVNQPAVIPVALPASRAGATRLQSRLGWAVAAIAIVTLGIVSWVYVREQPPVAPPVHLTVPLAEEVPPSFVALSPDGRTLVTTQPGTGLRLYSLDSGETRILTGTVAARTPFWSPDSRTIAFFAEGMLKTVPASGGPPQRLCGDTGLGGGGSWSRSGVILFAADSGALRRVAAGGGECTDVVRVPGELRARLPVFLPDGNHFLYSRQEGLGRPEVYVGSLEEPNGRRLLPDFSSAEFVPDRPGSNTGHVLFVREQTLMAQRFDAASLELLREPSAIASQVGVSATPPQIAASASTNGTIVYLANGRPDRQLVWYDHSGKEIRRGAAAGLGASAASLAPNGRWLAYVRTDAQFTLEERLVDLERQQETRLFAPPLAPPVVWSPDAVRLTFRGVVMGTPGIYLRNLNGGREELLLREDKNMRIPSNWTRNNRWILFTEITEQTRGDIWMVPSLGRGSEARPVPLLQTPANESQGQVSPDGRWIAYSSDETGSDQVYVRPFAERDLGREPVWAVPTAGGREPRWRADGKELFYLVRVPGTSRVRVMSVPVGATQNPLGDAKALFEVPVGLTVPQNNNFAYDASSDGQRFVFMTLAAEARPSLDVLLNWAGNQSR